MFAGPNGSGKSTITTRFQQLPGFPARYINPDVLTQQLPGDASTYLERSRQAQQIAVQQRQSLIASGSSFAFETVMSHPSKIAVLHQAKAAGFDVNVVFVCTSDPDINVARVALRVRAGGYDVPADKIVSRYYRALNLLPSAIESADQAVVFDNTDSYSYKAIFENGQLSEKDSGSPVWIDQVTNLVTERLQERQQLLSIAVEQSLTLQSANVDSGSYADPITVVSDHYAVQRVADDLRVLHDLRLVTVELNTSLQIDYTQGVPAVQIEPERRSEMEL